MAGGIGWADGGVGWKDGGVGWGPGRNPIKPPENRFRDATTVEEVVGQAVGAGSVCWENVRAAGVFQSDEAARIVQEALARLAELTGVTTP